MDIPGMMSSQWQMNIKATVWESLEKLITELLRHLGNLWYELSDRLLPLAIQLQPIWEDPLWQALAVLLLVIIVLIVSWWVLLKGQQLSFSLLKSIAITCLRIVSNSAKNLVHGISWLRNKKKATI